MIKHQNGGPTRTETGLKKQLLRSKVGGNTPIEVAFGFEVPPAPAIKEKP